MPLYSDPSNYDNRRECCYYCKHSVKHKISAHRLCKIDDVYVNNMDYCSKFTWRKP